MAILTDEEIIAELATPKTKTITIEKTYLPIEVSEFHCYYDVNAWKCKVTLRSDIDTKEVIVDVNEALDENNQSQGVLLLARLYLLAINK